MIEIRAIRQYVDKLWHILSDSRSSVKDDEYSSLAKSFEQLVSESDLPDFPGLVPKGGTPGQVLRKTGSDDYDMEWSAEDPALAEDIDPTINLGGISTGQQIQAGTSVGDVFSDLLTPPILTPPFGELFFDIDKVVKVGEFIPSTSAILVLNRGSIAPQYGADSPYRCGEGTFSAELQDSETVYHETNNSGTFTIPEFTRNAPGTAVVRFVIDYTQGVQPKTERGRDYDSPFPGGRFEFIREVEFVLPFRVGVSATPTITGLDVLQELVDTVGDKRVSFSTNNQYMVFAYPVSYGELNSITDRNGNETLGDWNVSELNGYRVYVSEFPTTEGDRNYDFKF